MALRQRAEDHPKRFLNFIFFKGRTRFASIGHGSFGTRQRTRLQAKDNPEQLLGRGPGAFRPASAGNRFGRIEKWRRGAWRQPTVRRRKEREIGLRGKLQKRG